MEIFYQIVSNLGFPIAVTAFLLMRVDKKLEDLNKTLIEMLEVFGKHD